VPDVDRLLCAHCGAEAYDCTGEQDYACKANCRGPHRMLIDVVRESALNSKELVRLKLENDRLSIALRDALTLLAAREA
jgi:hypothetical protein